MNCKTILLLILLAHTIYLKSQQKETYKKSALQLDSFLFASNAPLNIHVKSDFRQLKKTKAQPKYQKAKVKIHINDSIKFSYKAKIKARGNNRRETCIFQPLLLNFKKSSKKKNKMKYSKFKMVVPCMENKISEKQLLKEFLCYKIYSALFQTSFKVRLLEAKFTDVGYENPRKYKSYAFLIENEKMMLNRLNCIAEENESLSQIHIDQNNIMHLAMFQFMIGNFDWAVPTQQNLKLARPQNQLDIVYAIPYDFDYCGLVNANYAIPNEKLGIGSVKQRIYLGECKNEDKFKPIIEFYNKNKSVIINEIISFQHLSEKEKHRIIKYIEEFYEIMNSEKFYKRHILKNCKEIRKD